jgi:hypothetical protein
MISGAPLRPALLLVAALGPACRAPDGGAPASRDAPVTVAAQPVDELRESARTLLETNCGECHVRGSPHALPRALAVYDLEQLDWSRRMTDDQLRQAEGRLREPIAPTPGEDEVRAVRASTQELERFHAYVEREVARRDGGRP